MTKFELSDILKNGTTSEKIRALESLSDSKSKEVILKVISELDDLDIKVRGEAFSCLVLNENDISDILIENLDSESKNIRAFLALVLANRKDKNAIPEIIRLTKDPSSMVRSCALGALGHLRAQEARREIHDCLRDSNMEVKKSALQAAIDVGESILSDEVTEISKEKDQELEKLLVKVNKR